MKWSAHSPDLNPIENYGYIIRDQIRKRKPGTVNDLWNKIKEKLKNLTPKLCKLLRTPISRDY